MLLNENIFKLLSKRRNSIMGLASLCILIFHYTFFPIFTKGAFAYSIEKFIKINGNIGVDFFFLLSGFSLLYSIEKNSIKKFYYNRFKKLIIPYTFSVIVYCYIEKISFIDTIKGYIGYSFIFEDMFATPWFVPAIAILYLLFPAYYYLFNKSKKKTMFTVFIIIILWLLLSGYFHIPIRSDLINFFTRIPTFLVGVLFGHYSKYGYVKEINVKKTNILLYILSLTLLVVSIYLIYLNRKDGLVLPQLLRIYFLPAFFVAISGTILYTIIFSHNDIICVTVDRILNYIGKYSFEIYCIEDFSKCFIYFIDPYINNVFIKNLVLLTEILITAYGLSYVSRKIIEKIELVLQI